MHARLKTLWWGTVLAIASGTAMAADGKFDDVLVYDRS